MSTVSPATLDNLFTPEALANPYPIYAQLRETDPVHWNALLNMWQITRYEDVQAAFQDPRFSSAWPTKRRFGRELTESEQAGLTHFVNIFSRMMVWQDGRNHARLRGIVHKVFTPQVVARMQDRVQHLVDRYIDEFETRRSVDIIAELAFRLPPVVLMSMCGVPEDLHRHVQAGAKAQVDFFGMVEPAPGQFEEMLRIQRESESYILRLIAERRAHPQDDLLSLLVTAEDNGQSLSEEEICAFVYMLLAAGYETTGSLIANMMLALLQHPDQLALLRASPELIDNAIEETVRYSGPMVGMLRVTTEDVPLGGAVIPAGQMVMLMMASANRDPVQFSEADRFDITRKLGRHLGFGYGAHYCIGAPLARLKVRIVVNTLLRRLPDMRLATDNLSWLPWLNIRALQTLPVTFA